MQITNHLFFDGQCADAFRFYEQLLGGTLRALVPAGEMPGEHAVPAASRDRIMHAYLQLGDQALMGSDWLAERPFEPPQGFYVSLSLDNTGEAERTFEALAEGGTVHMKFEPTFFAHGFGMLVDRFGIPWMVYCPREAANT